MDGRTFRLTSSRSLVLDVAHIAKKVPAFPVERWFDLEAVAQARAQAAPRISWVTLFVKAYGLTSRQLPQLRTHYLKYPFPHFFQAAGSVISVSINRFYEGQDRLFWGRFNQPENLRLVDLQSQLDTYCQGDVTQVFKRQMLVARMPTPLRRLGWWWRLNFQPQQRARRLGTGSISVLAGQGVYNRLHPCILSSTLAYGPMQPDGRMWVTLQCDHRVIDGVAAAEALNMFETVLKNELLAELELLRHDQRQVA
jgi:2-oxoacid dehydrogenases acyltransferase (catalytic domain)